MRQYNNELYHTGVLGMRWGHRKTSENVGSSVNQRIMSKKVRDQYATNRIANVGADKAIDDELTAYDKKQQINKRVGKIIGIGGLTVAVVTASAPILITTGVAWTTHMLASTASNVGGIINTDKNIQTIKRNAGITIMTTDNIAKGKTWMHMLDTDGE